MAATSHVPVNSAKNQEECIGLLLLSFLGLIGIAMGIVAAKFTDDYTGPGFQINSASLSTFSISWWSPTITADWNISLTATNPSYKWNVSYDFIEVSVFHQDSLLSSHVLPSIRQRPGAELLLNVNIPASSVKIDAKAADSMRKKKRLQNYVSVDVVVRGRISDDGCNVCDFGNRNKRFVASCKNVQLQFLPSGEFFSSSGRAEIVTKSPIRCETTMNID